MIRHQIKDIKRYGGGLGANSMFNVNRDIFILRQTSGFHFCVHVVNELVRFIRAMFRSELFGVLMSLQLITTILQPFIVLILKMHCSLF